jgi:hypothetical protein
MSWHDELSANELEVGRELPSLPFKSMPKSCGWLGDYTLTAKEQSPEARPRIISDNRHQFVANDFT